MKKTTIQLTVPLPKERVMWALDNMVDIAVGYVSQCGGRAADDVRDVCRVIRKKVKRANV